MVHAALLAVAIAAAEYEVAWQESGWQAGNQAQGFRVAFTGDGMELSPQEGAETSWEWGLTFLGYGRPGGVQPASVGAFAPKGRRVERARPGIVEWYVNSEDGLEHGFTIAAPPRASRTSSEVFVEMAFSGSLSPTFSKDGQAIDFRGADGSYLRYGKLEVIDASGRKLASRMEGFAEPGVRGIRIRFDDAGAHYPVTVDPMVTTAAWTVESNQNNAQLGIGLSSAGDVNGDGYSDVIVSAPIYAEGTLNEGKVWVYHGSPSGPGASAAWSIQSDQVNAQLGTVVTLAGDVNGDGYGDVLVGSPNFDVAALADAGKIELFLGSPTGLAATPAWTSTGTTSFQGLGGAVASAGDVNSDGFDDVLVGEAGYTNGQSAEGRALLYLGAGSGLAASPSWSVEGNRVDALMGSAVATAGDVNADGYGDVIIGAVFWNNGQEAEGRADVYLGSASGLATTPVWTKESDQVFAQFGASVGTAGDVNGDGYADIIVGAEGFDNGQENEGAAFVYYGSPSGPATTHAWMVESNQAPTPGFNTPTEYGGSVSTAGDVNGDGYADVIVAAVGYDDPVQEEGVAFLYLGSASGLSTTHVLRYKSSQLNAQLGRIVRGAGDVNGDGYSDLLAGSSQYDNGQTNEGRAFLYLGAAAVVTLTAQWTGEGGQMDARYGESVASAGDVDGDGYSDVLVGAPSYNGTAGGEGRVYLYRGSDAGPALAPAWTVTGDQFVEAVGRAIASAGDVNGDGYSDVILGSEFFDAPASNAGRARLYLGSPVGLAATPAWTVAGTAMNESVGRAVGSAGDVNGDGYSDVLVAAAFQLRLYLGAPSGLPTTPSWVGPGLPSSGIHWPVVGSAGDVNGDGRSDVIVGASGHTNGGQARVYLGTATGLTASAVWSVDGGAAGVGLGASATSAGDVNGDGFSDVIVGAPFHTNDEFSQGRAWVYLGSATGLATTPAWTATWGSGTTYFGGAASGLGDINLDGYGDVVVGVSNPAFKGNVQLYLGSQAGLSPIASTTLSLVPGLVDRFGWAVANAGDANGDGFPDLVVGAPFYTAPETREGGVFFYYGNGRDGFDRKPRQYQIDGSGPIHFLGKSTAQTGFRIAERGIPAAGRSRIRLEWEIEPIDTPFDGVGIGSTPMADTGAPGPSGSLALYSQIVSGLGEGGHYKWRTRIVTDNPLFPSSPWKSMPNNAMTEAKLRTFGCLDRDGDGYGANPDAACTSPDVDCDDQTALLWALPGETSGLVFSSKTQASWLAPANPGGLAGLTYAVVQLETASGLGVPVCLPDANDANTTITLGSAPLPGTGYYFLSQARNDCGPGTWGQASSGTERVYPLTCP